MSLHLHLHLHLPDRTLIADWPLIGRRQKPQRVLFSSCQGFWNTVEGLGAETLLCQHIDADISRGEERRRERTSREHRERGTRDGEYPRLRLCLL
ncbi:hypothetical protein I7I48_09718 [Histoplasma ohiense]|nr:hypothetical protein I7I48_09718 [Histoplasma ohiense (nom. inval.)]